jgi:hypothetical protein
MLSPLPTSRYGRLISKRVINVDDNGKKDKGKVNDLVGASNWEHDPPKVKRRRLHELEIQLTSDLVLPFTFQTPPTAEEETLMKKQQKWWCGAPLEQPHRHLFVFSIRHKFQTDEHAVKMLLRYHRVFVRAREKGEKTVDYLFYINGLLDSYLKIRTDQWQGDDAGSVWPAHLVNDKR